MSAWARSAFFWLAVLLVAAEAVAWIVSPYRLVPGADEVVRNPTKHRGWPEYLDVADDDRPLVVLIGNSQGLGGEMADPDMIYSARLREALSRRKIRFENWSTGGLRTAELELLTLAAVRRGADHLVIVVTMHNFDPPDRVTLDYAFSDIPLVAGSPAVWPSLARTVLARQTGPEDIAPWTARLSSALVRSRTAVLDSVAARIPLERHCLVFGREIRPGGRLDALADPARHAYFPATDLTEATLRARRAQMDAAPEDCDAAGLGPRLETFAAVHDLLRARLDERGVTLTWIWNPLAPGWATAGCEDALRRFLDGAEAVTTRSGTRAHDLTDAMEARHFATHGHFNEEGHREFARLLLQLTRPEIDALGERP